VVGRAGGADHPRAAGHGQLDRGAADTAGGTVDQQQASAPHAELVERAGGRLGRGRESRRPREVERRRDRRVPGQHGQLGLGRSVGGQSEHPIAHRDVGDVVAELVDDPRCS
jgi:hypothetical protein